MEDGSTELRSGLGAAVDASTDTGEIYSTGNAGGNSRTSLRVAPRQMALGGALLQDPFACLAGDRIGTGSLARQPDRACARDPRWRCARSADRRNTLRDHRACVVRAAGTGACSANAV